MGLARPSERVVRVAVPTIFVDISPVLVKINMNMEEPQLQQYNSAIPSIQAKCIQQGRSIYKNIPNIATQQDGR